MCHRTALTCAHVQRRHRLKQKEREQDQAEQLRQVFPSVSQMAA